MNQNIKTRRPQHRSYSFNTFVVTNRYSCSRTSRHTYTFFKHGCTQTPLPTNSPAHKNGSLEATSQACSSSASRSLPRGGFVFLPLHRRRPSWDHSHTVCGRVRTARHICTSTRQSRAEKYSGKGRGKNQEYPEVLYSRACQRRTEEHRRQRREKTRKL